MPVLAATATEGAAMLNSPHAATFAAATGSTTEFIRGLRVPPINLVKLFVRV